jgi:S-adenosylmethionine synthetase
MADVVNLTLNAWVETAAKTGMIMVLGEITSNAVIDYQKVRGCRCRCHGVVIAATNTHAV